MVGFGMILDSQEGEDFAIHKVRRFQETANRTNDVEPPPYTDSSFTEPPLPPLPTASGSRSPPQKVVSTVSNANQPAEPRRPLSSPQPSVCQIHRQEKHAPILGTFHIDPRLPSIGFNANGDKARKKNPPHASFRTRNAKISLELGTAGNLDAAFPKANVLVATRHGNIDIKLLSSSPLYPALGLEVHSRGGNILVFVPKDFSGALQITSHKGRFEFLPAFASKMRVMKQSHKDALVMIGGEQGGEARDMNFCELKSRSGKIIVGISDIDKYEVKTGFWRRMLGGS